jgi:hypothetical protein
LGLPGFQITLIDYGSLVAYMQLKELFQTIIDNSNRNWAMHVIDWLDNKSHDDTA